MMEVATMGGPLKKYRYGADARATVLKLTEADAERLGLTEADLVGGAPKEAADEEPAEVDSGAEPGPTAVVANKARTTEPAKPGRRRRKPADTAAGDSTEASSGAGDPDASTADGGDGGSDGGD